MDSCWLVDEPNKALQVAVETNAEEEHGKESELVGAECLQSYIKKA